MRDIGSWDGINIRGTVGAREGRYDKNFVEWCVQHKILLIRTVDCAGQKVWLARFPRIADGIRFWQFTAAGEVCPCDTLQSKS